MAIRLRVWQHGEPQGALEPGDVLLPPACGRLGAQVLREVVLHALEGCGARRQLLDELHQLEPLLASEDLPKGVEISVTERRSRSW